MSRIVTLRNLIGTTASNNAALDRHSLHTIQGLKGYRITKFELLPYDFGATASELEATVKVYSEHPGTPDAQIDFSDNRLIAAAVMAGAVDAYNYGISDAIIFDSQIFNQDIYVTYYNNKTNEAAGFVNYYIELEQIDLALDEATVATLKDIRNSN